MYSPGIGHSLTILPAAVSHRTTRVTAGPPFFSTNLVVRTARLSAGRTASPLTDSGGTPGTATAVDSPGSGARPTTHGSAADFSGSASFTGPSDFGSGFSSPAGSTIGLGSSDEDGGGGGGPCCFFLHPTSASDRTRRARAVRRKNTS